MPRKAKSKDPEHDRLELDMLTAKVAWISSPALQRDKRYAEYMDAKRAYEAKYPPPPLI